MALYRKKPVVVEAMQFEGLPFSDEFLAFLFRCAEGYDVAADARLIVMTLHGEVYADPGDWVIRGPSGDYYPCKPDIFAATYELVEEE